MNRKLVLVAVAVGVIALGGGVAAASQHWLITSTNQIKPSVLKSLHGATGAAGVAGQPGTQGPQGTPGQAVTVSGQTVVGPAGTQGPPGQTGATGGFNLGSIHYRPTSTYIEVGPGVTQSVSAECNDGEYVIGGGDYGYNVDVIESYPQHNWTGNHPADDAWEIEVVGTGTYGDVEAYAICASSS